jgi:glycosyltransferase involved in cell wall biosynthesis
MAAKKTKRRIAINALSARIGGGVTYLRNIVPRLARLDADNEYYLFISDESYQSIFESIKIDHMVKVVKIRTSNLLVRMLREQFLVPFMIRRHKIDILYCPANIVSFFAPCKKILWIQNIDPFVDVKCDTFLRRIRIRLLGLLTYLSMRAASIVVFSSNFSRRLVFEKTKIKQDKTRRIFLGAEIGAFQKSGGDAPAREFDYILSVSNISKRKNYEILIRAYNELRPELRQKYKLMLVGDISESYRSRLYDLCPSDEQRKNIIFCGMLSGEKLTDAYRKATLFVLPSLVESFSLPVIEAMAAGLPVIASNVTCLPEMIGESGVLFNPFDHSHLASRIESVLLDDDLRSDLSSRARHKAQVFSWDRTADEILKVFKEL